FRNTRRQLTGFPRRVLNAWPLQETRSEVEIGSEDISASAEISSDPISASDPFTHDPRVQWLADWLTGPESKKREGKTLLICAHDALAVALEKHLRLKVGVRSTVFHRHMSLLERD